jgi:hypothetical protein
MGGIDLSVDEIVDNVVSDLRKSTKMLKTNELLWLVEEVNILLSLIIS